MSTKVLVTDSLFIFDEHEKRIRDAGYSVVRLDKTVPSEEELSRAIKGKAGYIIGGLEKVTKKVIAAADELKVIGFTGIGYESFIPGWREAARKGIVITNTPEGPTQAVAEWALGAALLMNRQFLSFGKFGAKGFEVTKGIEDQTIGIIGLGRIGSRIAEMIQVFKPREINYFSRKVNTETEKKLKINHQDLDTLLKNSDILFLAVSDEGNQGFFNQEKIAKMKQGSLLVSFMHPGIIDEQNLFEALETGKIRAISDYPMSKRFESLPLDSWYSFTGSNTITKSEAKLASDIAVTSVLNILSGKKDKYRVN